MMAMIAAHDPEQQVDRIQRVQVVHVLNQSEPGTDRESVNGAVDEEANSAGSDNEDHEQGLQAFFDNGGGRRRNFPKRFF